MTAYTTLAPSPFCGATANGYDIAPHCHSDAIKKLIPDLPNHPGSYVIEGDCACGAGLIGAEQAKVKQCWNRRPPAPARQGQSVGICAECRPPTSTAGID